MQLLAQGYYASKSHLLCKQIQFRKVFWNGRFQIFGLLVKMEAAHLLSTDQGRDMKVIFFD